MEVPRAELAIFSPAQSKLSWLVKKRYANADFCGIEDIVEGFLAELDQLPQCACFAVAGPVSGDKAILTNLPWEVDCRLLENRFGFHRVVLINDLTAVCGSLALLDSTDLYEIQKGNGSKGEVRGVLAPGTGLGEGLLVEIAGQSFVRGSEGGHTDFGPVDAEQLGLLAWMQKKSKPVSYEMLIAGPGLANLYDFCRNYHQIQESAWIVEALSKAMDRIPVIVAGATGTIGDTSCPLCRRVIDLFLSILGSEAGNLALKLYARGGIYLGGGILPRLMGQFKFDGFLESFSRQGADDSFYEGNSCLFDTEKRCSTCRGSTICPARAEREMS